MWASRTHAHELAQRVGAPREGQPRLVADGARKLRLCGLRAVGAAFPVRVVHLRVLRATRAQLLE